MALNFLKSLFQRPAGSAAAKKSPVVKTTQKKTAAVPVRRKKTAVPLPKKTLSGKVPRQPKEKDIGVITHYFGKISVGIIKLKSPLSVGDTIRIVGMHDNVTLTVRSMQIDHADVATAKRGDEVGIKINGKVHQNSRVRKAAS